MKFTLSWLKMYLGRPTEVDQAEMAGELAHVPALARRDVDAQLAVASRRGEPIALSRHESCVGLYIHDVTTAPSLARTATLLAPARRLDQMS
jgi:hypothetical protein